jgi:peroxiredoxin
MSRTKPKSWRSILLWSLAVIALVAIVYSFRAAPNGEPIRDPEARTGTMEFSAADLNGTTWKLSAHRGKVVLLNVFATWCPPCRQETPGLVRLSKEFAGKGVSVVGVSMDEGGAGVVEQFVKEYNITYPVLLPPASDPLTAGIQAIPVTFLIDRQGRLAKHYVGAVEQSTFARDIEEVLKENDKS